MLRHLFKVLLRTLLLLVVCSNCCGAPQSYYSQYPYRRAAYASPYGSNSINSVSAYTPYSDSYASSAYNAALQQRRARARAAASRNGYGSSASADVYNSRLPVRASSIAAISDDGTIDRIKHKNNYNDVDSGSAAYRSSRKRQQNEGAARSKQRVSKADAENAKFAGANNLEADEESGKTLALLKRKRQHRFRLGSKRCFPFGRDAAAAGNGKTTATSASTVPSEQGRFLFDFNVYNVYPNGYIGGGGGGGLFSDAPFGGVCGGGGGGLLGGGGGGLLGGGGGGLLDGGGLLGGGGLLSDPIAAPAYQQAPLNNLLQLFAPGILQNALAATARPPALRPQLQVDAVDDEVNDLTSDPEVDPAYTAPARPVPVRRPNRVFYDSAGASPITPAQLVGGVATTVNGIIQQLTGNVQPVYPSYRRAPSYGK